MNTFKLQRIETERGPRWLVLPHSSDKPIAGSVSVQEAGELVRMLETVCARWNSRRLENYLLGP